MLGLGESNEEIIEVMKDMREHLVDHITLGQYLQPSKDHLKIERFATPEEFKELGRIAKEMGFIRVASGPLVRSSYHADLQAKRSEEHTSELQSRPHLVCRLLL